MRGAPVGEVAHVRVPALVQGDQVLELAQHVEGAALVALTGPYRRARGLGGVVGRHGASPCEEMRNGDVGRMPDPMVTRGHPAPAVAWGASRPVTGRPPRDSDGKSPAVRWRHQRHWVIMVSRAGGRSAATGRTGS